MKKILGYLLAGIGIIGMFLSSTAGRQFVPVLEGVKQNFILYPALVALALGVVILIVTGSGGSKWRVKQIENEVPIYHGEGKKRKIVGYKADKK